MEKELTIKNRLIILAVLPGENDIASLKIMRGLQETLGITEEEHKKVELTIKEGNYSWKEELDVPKKFEIGEKATDIIVDALTKVNAQKKITMQMIDTYEMFIK